MEELAPKNETEVGPEFSASGGVIEADIFIGLLLLACFLVGGLGNTSALVYFVRESGNTVMLITLRFFAFTDVVKSALVLPMFLSYFCGRQKMLFAGWVLCTAWTLLFSSTTQFSLLLVAVMSILRGLHQFSPNRVRSSTAITVLIILCAVGILTLNLSPAIFWNLTAEYTPSHVVCSWCISPNISSTSHNSTHHVQEHSRGHPYNLINVLLTITPLALLTPITCGFFLNLFHLNKTRTIELQTPEEGEEGALTPKEERHYTSTIMIVSGVYLLLNLPLLFAFFIDSSDGHVDRTIGFQLDGPNFYATNFIYILSGPLSTIADFFVFFTRIPRFRKGIEQGSRKKLKRLRI